MKEHFLKGKKVLLISYGFYDYPESIAEQIRSKGAEVFYVNTSVSSKIAPLNLLLLGLSKKRKLECLIKNRIKKITDHIDVVLVININILSDNLFKWVLERYVDAHKILYLWDSMAHSRYAPNILKMFDEVFSFDPRDCDEYGFSFLPLFYRSSPESLPSFKYDFVFVGVARDDRYKLTQFVKRYCETNGLTCFVYLYFRSRLFYLFRKWFRRQYLGSSLKDFKFKKMKKDDLDDLISKSRIVIDSAIDGQAGLTMRTIECLGAHKKMITTNKEIKKYDFYRSNNFCLVDQNNVEISKDFINSDYEIIPDDIYENYSLGHWVDALFERASNVD